MPSASRNLYLITKLIESIDEILTFLANAFATLPRLVYTNVPDIKGTRFAEIFELLAPTPQDVYKDAKVRLVISVLLVTFFRTVLGSTNLDIIIEGALDLLFRRFGPRL